LQNEESSLQFCLVTENIDTNFEEKVKQCNQFQLSIPSSPVVPMHPWDWPELPCQHIHTGPINGKNILDAPQNG